MKTSIGDVVRDMTDEEVAALPNPQPIFSAPRLPHLEPDQFWFVVRASGHEEDLLGWVSSLNDPESSVYDPMAWAVASAKLDFAKFFERDHPLVEAARVALGMTGAELDDLWRYAAG